MDRVYQYQRDIMAGKAKYKYSLVLWILIPPLMATIFPILFYEVLGMDEGKVMSTVLSWTAIPFLLFSLFLLQRYNLIGKYGEAIILLIPTFIWLLPEYKDVIRILLWCCLGASVIMVALFFATIAAMKMKNIEKGAMISMLTSKIKFMLAAVVITLTISFSLIHWGDEGMGWLPKGATETAELSKSTWVVFIAIVAIVVVMLLILEGVFADFLVVKYNTIDDSTTELSLEVKQRMRTIQRERRKQDRTQKLSTNAKKISKPKKKKGK